MFHKTRKYRMGVVVGIAMIMAGILILPASSVRAWSVSGVLNKPSTIYPGSTYTFTLDVTNTGSDSMQIANIWLGFDWQTSGYAYVNNDVPTVIGSGNTYTFSWSVQIPDGITTNTNHIATVTIEAADPGLIDPWGFTTTNTIDYQVYISTESTSGGDDTGGSGDDGEDSGGLPGFDMPIIVIASLVSIGIFAVMKKRR